MRENLSRFEELIGYTFSDHTQLRQALTHPSFEHEQSVCGSYQRLEFFGDAVLGMLLAEYLYQNFPDYNEGFLSRFRSMLADQETLAGIARRISLGNFIRLGRGEELSGGREKDSILADVLEATIAAVYLDGGLDQARHLIVRLFAYLVNQRASLITSSDAKSELQEQLSSRRLPSPVYKLVGESGPPHDRLFRFQVLIGADVAGEGEGRSKKNAQQVAAAQALKGLLQPDVAGQ